VAVCQAGCGRLIDLSQTWRFWESALRILGSDGKEIGLPGEDSWHAIERELCSPALIIVGSD
jgi:hypothetical protein